MEKSIEDDYISLLTIAKKLWGKRKKLLRIVLVFFLIGLFIAIFTPEQFTAKVKFLSNTSSISKVSGKWSGIAALVGVNLNTGTENTEIAPNIYPKIINSFPFQKALMETKLNFKELDSAISFREYFLNIEETGVLKTTKKYTIGLPGTIVNAFKKDKKQEKSIMQLDSVLFITKEEQKLRQVLNNSIFFSIDETDGVISITATMPEAIPAAQLVRRAQELLQRDIINYRIKKAQDQMDFIVNQLAIQKTKFNKIQAKFASYKDRNQFNITQASQIEFQKQQLEYDLAYSVYSELERQRVAQEIQVKKDTPIFTTLNPASVPLDPSNPNKFRTIILFIIIGLMVAIFYGLWQEFYKNFKRIWKKVD